MYEFKSENIMTAFDQTHLMITDVNRRIDHLTDDMECIRSRLEELWTLLKEANVIDG